MWRRRPVPGEVDKTVKEKDKMRSMHMHHHGETNGSSATLTFTCLRAWARTRTSLDLGISQPSHMLLLTAASIQLDRDGARQTDGETD